MERGDASTREACGISRVSTFDVRSAMCHDSRLFKSAICHDVGGVVRAYPIGGFLRSMPRRIERGAELVRVR